MPGSAIVEVAIGVVFVYLLLSLICSSLNEWIAAKRNMRAKTLEEGIRNLLNDPQGTALAGDLLKHPFIKGLARPGDMPSYIPSRNFAIALFDMIAPADPAAGARTLKDIREKVAQLPNPAVQKTLLLLIDDAEGDLKKARQSVERWFDDAMDRVSGWYTRNTRAVILGLALAVSVALNVDTIFIARSLWYDGSMRASLVSAAGEFARQPSSTGAQPLENVKQVQAEIRKLPFPIGWSLAPKDVRGIPSTFWGVVTKIIGLLFTTVAVSLGAPFWFDILNKLVNLRAAGKQPEKAAAAKSEGQPGSGDQGSGIL